MYITVRRLESTRVGTGLLLILKVGDNSGEAQEEIKN